jgi:hypothetical protein
MLNRKKASAALFLVSLIAANALTARPGNAEPARDECVTKPSMIAPAGSHWDHRADKANPGKRCWYLAAKNKNEGKAESKKARSVASLREMAPTPIPRPDPRPRSEPFVVASVIDTPVTLPIGEANEAPVLSDTEPLALPNPAGPPAMASFAGLVPGAAGLTDGGPARARPAPPIQRGDRASTQPLQHDAALVSQVTPPATGGQSGESGKQPEATTFAFSLLLLIYAAVIAGVAFFLFFAILKFFASKSGQANGDTPWRAVQRYFAEILAARKRASNSMTGAAGSAEERSVTGAGTPPGWGRFAPLDACRSASELARSKMRG